MIRHHAKSQDKLPLVVQVGFAGARSLFDSEEYPNVDADEFEQRLVEKLSQTLAELPKELNLQDKRFFFCGISQIAVGGDTVFTKACRNAGFVQRIFLPQHRDVYLTAEGSDGPDFTNAQRETATELLESPHVVQQRLVSDSPDRHARFRDTNVEIVRVSDVLICSTLLSKCMRK